MFEWLKRLLISQALVYAVRAVVRWKDSLDWEKIVATLQERLPGIIPFQVFDEAVTDFIVSCVKAIRDAVEAPLLQKIIDLGIAQKWHEAFVTLWEALVAAYTPEQSASFAVATDEQKEAMAIAAVQHAIKKLTYSVEQPARLDKSPL